jgi:hypothetical protein
MVSPYVSNILVDDLKFMWTMIIVGLFGIISLVAAMVFIPSALDQPITEEEVQLLDDDADVSGGKNPDQVLKEKRDANKFKITIWTILSQRQCLFAILSTFFGAYNLRYYDAWLEAEMERLQVSTLVTSYMYMV